MTLNSIADLFKSTLPADEKTLYAVVGWVKSTQKFNSVQFTLLNDGSYLPGLQVVSTPSLVEGLELTPGTALQVSGYLSKSKGGRQSLELKAVELKVLSPVGRDFPLLPVKLSLDYLRTQQLVRHRTSLFQSVFEIRRELIQSIYSFFYEHHFFPVMAPILTTNSCEGGSELFQLSREDADFFKKKEILLSVSGQFYCEAVSLGLKNSFSFGPTFRAEKSNSVSHLAEFWMIEVEQSFTNLSQIIDFTYKFFIFLISNVLSNCRIYLEELSNFEPENKDLIPSLEELVSSSYEVITYTEGVELIQKHKSFEWGEGFSKEDEQFLCKSKGKKILFVTGFPSGSKPFYMKRSEDGKITYSFDMLIEGIGELAGGSERESDFEKLQSTIEEMNLKSEELDWYLQLRKYGYYSSAGFGMGFERLLMFVTRLKNIKDLATFPRSYGSLQL